MYVYLAYLDYKYWYNLGHPSVGLQRPGRVYDGSNWIKGEWSLIRLQKGNLNILVWFKDANTVIKKLYLSNEFAIAITNWFL